MASFTTWQNTDPRDPILGPSPVFRSPLDAILAGYRRTPEAQYPDGYLGTITNRRSDRMNNGPRGTQKSYERGVHKGERIDPGDYMWPREFGLMTGLELQAKGQKFAPPGAEPVMLTNDGKIGPRGIERTPSGIPQTEIDTRRREQFLRFMPRWK
jgi:hypothetical protein